MKAKRWLADWLAGWVPLARLVPRVCLDCELHTTQPIDLCPYCRAALPWNVCACARCALPLPARDACCGGCQRSPLPFTSAIAPLRYEAPVTGWIHAAKFSASPVHLHALTALLAGHLEAAGAARPERLVPVPLSRRRLLRRGHNQAALLAARVGRLLGVPVANALVTRCRHTPPQQGLSRRARMTNPAGAFAVAGRSPAHVAIIDDVITTGATTAEVARTLLAAGAERVDVWAVARATLDP